MKVRFRSAYCADADYRIAYELVSNEIVYNEDCEQCFDLKLMGFVPIRKLEDTDGTEIDAIDVYIKLTNL